MISLQTYFVKEENWQVDEVIITEDAHHLIRVMRYEIDDNVMCVHPNGKIAKCNIVALDEASKIVRAKIVEWLPIDNELPVRITILQSLPKGNKLEWIIQKGTELGATRFLLFQSERSIVKWDKKKVKNRLQRYEKIAKEASEQSKRNMIPTIDYIDNMNQYIAKITTDQCLKIIAYEEEAKQERTSSFFQLLNRVNHHDEIVVCIGPEGGFTEKEVAFFKEKGFIPTRLGKRILRTETASLYALAAIAYHVEEME